MWRFVWRVIHGRVGTIIGVHVAGFVLACDAVLLYYVISQLICVEKLTFTLLAGMHNFDTIEEFIKVETTSIIVSLRTLQLS